MTTNVHTKFTELKEREQFLATKRAVLEAQEKTKAAERDKIDAQLRELGIDPEKAEEELVRLQTEEQTKLASAEKALDDYELALNQASASQSET